MIAWKQLHAGDWNNADEHTHSEPKQWSCELQNQSNELRDAIKPIKLILAGFHAIPPNSA